MNVTIGPPTPAPKMPKMYALLTVRDSLPEGGA